VLAEGFGWGLTEAVTDLHISKSFGWHEMPLPLRFVEYVKCGVLDVPEQVEARSVFATA
jgi:hypothetical protein